MTPVVTRLPEPGAGARWEETEVGEHRLRSRAWRSGGADRPEDVVVLVHGLVVSSSYHVPLACHLARQHEVHALDLPGFGRSSRPEVMLDTRALGLVLGGWLDANGLRGATLVANSYGCQVVTETLLARPDLAGRLVLLGPTIDRHGRRLDEQLRRWRLEQKTQSLQLQRVIAADYVRAGLRRALATFRHAMADAIEDRLPFLDLPTLVLRGTRDPIVSERWAREVTDLLPDATLVQAPGATHAVNHEMPLQTARITEHFLRRTAA
jgi:2-hydroxy-6-oxonona-2,4-dienedioate hydrolase